MGYLIKLLNAQVKRETSQIYTLNIYIYYMCIYNVSLACSRHLYKLR